MEPSPRRAIACVSRLQAGAVALLVVLFAGAWLLSPPHPVAPFAVTAPAVPAGRQSSAPLFSSRFASSETADFVHAASLAALPGGDLFAVWFAGSDEGARDVHIRAARYSASDGEWGVEQTIATPEATQRATGKYIRKLGNPVVALAPDGRLWLFYVSVSIGGWATSSINLMHSADLGASWSAPRQLVTTPFANISTLVRSAPVFHADGSIGLPVYHEMLGKFAEYLYLSPQGEVIDKFRISRGNDTLQPVVIPLDGRRALAMLRYAGDRHHRVMASRSEDSGQTWSETYPLHPANPNSSLAAVTSADQGLLVALNDLADGRFRLRLMKTDPALSQWTPVIDLDESPDPEGDPYALEAYRAIIGDKFRLSSGPRRQKLLDEFLARLDQRVCNAHGCDFEYEYPSFIRSADGRYHLVYSWNNTFIKHVSFNEAWLRVNL
ncbi:BNR repeat-like domain protein [compost metagenome]